MYNGEGPMCKDIKENRILYAIQDNDPFCTDIKTTYHILDCRYYENHCQFIGESKKMWKLQI